MALHRWFAVAIVWSVAWYATAQTQVELDVKALERLNYPTDTKRLIEFFEKQLLKDGDDKLLEAAVRRLDSGVFAVRDKAAKDLEFRGLLAIPFLKAGTTDASLETVRRVEQIIAKIEDKAKPDAIATAARVLAERGDVKAAMVLLNFAPAITDPYAEEEILTSIGRLTIRGDKVEQMVLDALNDKQPFRRSTAAYLLARRAGAGYRDTLRDLLSDANSRVRQKVMDGLYGQGLEESLKELRSGDEALLKGAKVELTEKGLLDYFRTRTPDDTNLKRARALASELGHSLYLKRVKANAEIRGLGISAMTFLRQGTLDLNAEAARRFDDSLIDLRSRTNTQIPTAAARMLLRPFEGKHAAPGESIRVLLAFTPFADDETVEAEILASMTRLSLRESAIEPALVTALTDAMPARRAAAAYVLGHVGGKQHVAKVAMLLDDTNPVVRMRATQGMIAARDNVALGTLPNLLINVPDTYLPLVEDTLSKLAGDKSPAEPVIADSRESRQKAAKAWTAWINANQGKVDLAGLSSRESYMGLVTVCEYDSRIGNIQGQVWEGPRTGDTKRWSFTGVVGAMDARTLSNGRVLVAENSGNKVTERDSTGKVLWEFRTPVNPICCQRLPNGNTFIASYNMFMEVRPDQTEVYRHMPGPQYHFFSCHVARNGNIVAITAQGQVVEMNGKSRAIENTINANTQGNWCSVEMMPNGNYLVASMSNNGTVRELDRKTGAEVWGKPFTNAFRATCLPNGNVLVCGMNTKQVAEMDRSGTIRWTVTTQGRPWAVHYR